MKTELQLRATIRRWIVVFIIFLILSGVTAFPIESELAFLVDHSSSWPQFMQLWIGKIYSAIKDTNAQYI
ncbi:MAG: hypothetical protein H0X46_04760, partial [Bacteroidetes bacterium]|nr:hypothetical protein [Bacteroidota bacterium]